MDWVNAFETNDEIDANLKKGLLEQAGISCMIEASIYRPRSIAPIYNQVKLYVRAEQLEAAQKILKDIR